VFRRESGTAAYGAAVRGSRHQARRRIIAIAAAIAVVGAAVVLLLTQLGQDSTDAFEAPVVANAAAVAGGLVVAGLTLAGLGRRTARRVRNSGKI
jgi:peptidoglycan/LPS O-acetylase OafA/YrhL